MNTSLAPLLAFASLSAIAVVAGWLFFRSWRKQRQLREDAAATEPCSDWPSSNSLQSLKQIEVLRDWMGEDHDLVRKLQDSQPTPLAPTKQEPIDVDIDLAALPPVDRGPKRISQTKESSHHSR